MMGHKICLNGEIWQIIPKLSLLPLFIWSTDMRFCHKMQNAMSHLLLIVIKQSLTHCTLVDSSTVICWMGPFVILGVSGIFLSLLF